MSQITQGLGDYDIDGMWRMETIEEEEEEESINPMPRRIQGTLMLWEM